MSVSRLVAAAATAVLATPAGAVPAAATPVSATPAGAAPAVAAPTAAPPFLPCPNAGVAERAGRPPRPSPPPGDQHAREIGGSALATAGLTIPPGAPPPPGAKLSATSWLVADLDSGAVLGGCGPHEYGTPASVQKLLLAATLMARIDPKQVVTVNQSDVDIEPGSSSVGLLLGGRYTVATLWLGLLLNSGNDAANTLARIGGGAAGVPGTLRAMNAEARRLGAYQTHAVTPSGLDGPGQFTSAYDLALIARECFANADFRRYVTTRQASMPPQPPQDPKGFQIQNENQLLYRYPGALGGKTGFTDLARHTYVGAAERNGRRLVATLLGAEPEPVRGWQQGAALLDWGFSLPAGASVGRLVSPGEAAGEGAQASPAGLAGHAIAKSSPVARATGVVGGWSPGLTTGVVAAAAVLALILFLAIRRRARRPTRARHTRS